MKKSISLLLLLVAIIHCVSCNSLVNDKNTHYNENDNLYNISETTTEIMLNKYEVYYSSGEKNGKTNSLNLQKIKMVNDAELKQHKEKLTYQLLDKEYTAFYYTASDGGLYIDEFIYKTEIGDEIGIDEFGNVVFFRSAAYFTCPEYKKEFISNDESRRIADSYYLKIFDDNILENFEYSVLYGGNGCCTYVYYLRKKDESGLRLPGSIVIILSQTGEFLGYYARYVELGNTKAVPDDYSQEKLRELCSNALGTYDFEVESATADIIYTGQLVIWAVVNYKDKNDEIMTVSLAIPLE